MFKNFTHKDVLKHQEEPAMIGVIEEAVQARRESDRLCKQRV